MIESNLTDGVATLRLADERHRNALSREMSDSLATAVEEVLAAGARAIVLTARPPVFCAGASLDALLARPLPLAEMYAGMNALAEAPVPTIAAVAGAAVGAGVNLPLACDIVLTTPRARFDPRFLDVGIHPGGGHLWRLRARIGEQGAAALVLCGDVLTGEEAVTRGLAWRCLPAGELEAFAMRLAGRAAGRSAALVRRTKNSLRAGRSLADPAAAAELELEAQRWSVEQPGFHESVLRVRESLADRERATT
jgi:enoyl-CoA hydratase